MSSPLSIMIFQRNNSLYSVKEMEKKDHISNEAIMQERMAFIMVFEYLFVSLTAFFIYNEQHSKTIVWYNLGVSSTFLDLHILDRNT
jgi:hypothetical protein